jgi:serine/threonine protein kinase
MEFYVASLDQYFLPKEDPKKYSGPIPSDEQFCFQLISGLQYIHGKRLIHGSIKPTNILISSSENDPQIKLSDFGLTTTSRLNEGHTTQRSIGGFLSSRYWLAPELLDCGQNEPTEESDIFSAGSVFFYFLSKGRHLFGDVIHKIITNTSEGIHANIFCKLNINQHLNIHLFSYFYL